MESPTLADWVGDLAAFADHRWQREPAVFTPARPASPFDLDALDAAFDSGLLRTPYLELVRSDKVVVPAEAFTTSRTVNGTTHHGFADRAKVLALLRTGATLLLRCVDQWHGPTGDLVARLSEELDRRVEAFFFLTPVGGQGLAVHRDDADVFVLQVSGRKTWYVHDAPAAAEWSLGELPDGERSAQRLHTVLGPGDVLYVPRAFAHRAVGAEGLSGHLSLTVRDLSVPDLRTALDQLLAEGLALPTRPLGEPAIAAAGAALLDHARARLDGITSEQLLRAARTGRARPPAATGTGTGTVTGADTFAGTARDWADDAPAGGPAGRTWRRLRAVARNGR
ncbi:cupin domain-containing protein [Kitasatospora sp. NPDC028055]|uniref:JmjC domain-containing protein n=1 Tax=Kitasatospora sp. NPDC028055 TaxID=3155653 RepID=UPI003408ACB2